MVIDGDYVEKISLAFVDSHQVVKHIEYEILVNLASWVGLKNGDAYFEGDRDDLRIDIFEPEE